MSRTLAKAVAPKGVYVFVVAPGWVATERVAKVDQRSGRFGGSNRLGASCDCRMRLPRVRYLSARWMHRRAWTGAILDVNGASYLRS